jgi:hypothetical protein
MQQQRKMYFIVFLGKSYFSFQRCAHEEQDGALEPSPDLRNSSGHTRAAATCHARSRTNQTRTDHRADQGASTGSKRRQSGKSAARWSYKRGADSATRDEQGIPIPYH